jgi:hypothetical protein
MKKKRRQLKWPHLPDPVQEIKNRDEKEEFIIAAKSAAFALMRALR